MTRITRQIAFFVTFAAAASGCQSSHQPGREPAARALQPTTLPATDGDARAAAAVQTSDHATGELARCLAAIDRARDIVSHNLSNADTIAYKGTVARCSNGGKLCCQVDFTQGSLENTGRFLDVAIQGQGFFKVKVSSSIGNGIGYTRNGNFVVNKTGELVVNIDDGYRLVPSIAIPRNATDITVGVDGTITIRLVGQTAKQTIGVIKLSQFMDPGSLARITDTIFGESDSAGPSADNLPGEGGAGELLQGFLEASNVDVNRESVHRDHFLDQWRAAVLHAAREPDANEGPLPTDDATGFDEIVKRLSSWDGIARQNAMFNHGKELTLSRIISNFPGVAAAEVMIDPRTERHIGGDIEPSAVVTVQMKTGEKPGRQLVKAVASVVAGAQSGLTIKNIRVVVDGIAQEVSDDQSGDASDARSP